MVLQFQTLYRLKRNYLRQFWSYIELGIIVCSWSIVGVYVWRYRESNRIQSLFRQSNGYAYINLQFAAYVNDLLTYFFGFCCFFATIKFIRLCRYNRRLLLFNQTLKLAGRSLMSFSFFFAIIFFSFICLYYLLFSAKIWSCASLLGTAQMLFEMILMKFNTKEFLAAAPFLGPFVFTLFMFLVVFVCANMFLSIITDSARLARENDGRDNEEIFTFMWDRLQRWIGKKRVVDVL